MNRILRNGVLVIGSRQPPAQCMFELVSGTQRLEIRSNRCDNPLADTVVGRSFSMWRIVCGGSGEPAGVSKGAGERLPDADRGKLARWRLGLSLDRYRG